MFLNFFTYFLKIVWSWFPGAVSNDAAPRKWLHIGVCFDFSRSLISSGCLFRDVRHTRQRGDCVFFMVSHLFAGLAPWNALLSRGSVSLICPTCCLPVPGKIKTATGIWKGIYQPLQNETSRQTFLFLPHEGCVFQAVFPLCVIMDNIVTVELYLFVQIPDPFRMETLCVFSYNFLSTHTLCWVLYFFISLLARHLMRKVLLSPF